MNAGLCVRCADDGAGAFVVGELVRHAEFSDGLSNTLAFSEKVIGSGPGTAPKRGSPFRDWNEHKLNWPRRGTADQWRSACAAEPIARAYWMTDGGASWLLGGAAYTAFFVAGLPDDRIPDCGTMSMEGTGLFSARSYHPGGVNAAMSDGSVRWCPSSIDLAVWRGLGTRAGGEVP